MQGPWKLDRVDRARPRWRAGWAALVALLLPMAGCVDASDDGGGLGVMRLALGANVPGASHMRVQVYHGPVLSASTKPRYALGCVAYADAGGAVKNPFTLDRLPVRSDYAVLVELFDDDQCTNRILRAYRGGIAVEAVSTATANLNPYYLQPARSDAFTGMAQASEIARLEVAKRSCSADSECQSAHAAAICRDNRCSLESLFPLNGGARRGLPSGVAISDGRVAIHGGVSVAGDAGVYAATSQRVEVFDPRLGRFEAPAATISAFDEVARTALGTTLPGDGNTLFAIGGSVRVVMAREGDKLRTGLDAATCAGGGACPVTAAVWRADLASKVSTGTQLGAPRALPIVARVVTPGGSRILVAGGAALPIPKSGDSRSGDARLCQLDGSTASCSDAKALMAAGRANAATLCLDATALGCRRLLIFGGRFSKSAPLAEIYDATKDAYEPVEIGPGVVPEHVHGGALVRLKGSRALLLGATGSVLFIDPGAIAKPNALAPLLVDIDESTSPTRLTLSAAPLGIHAGSDGGKRSLGAAIALDDGGALLVGGVDPAGKVLGDALRFDAEGAAIARLPLEQARYGADLVRVGGEGPFGGCVMTVGGFAAPAKGVDEPLSHVELFCSKAP